MALGEELQKARRDRRLTASEVAAGTRMKVQIVEALEQEDFEKIAAPIYAKGFIKLYAEYVGLDPKPLIDEYISRYVSPPPEPIFDNEFSYDEGEHETASRKFLFPRRHKEPEEEEKAQEPVDSEIVRGPSPDAAETDETEEPYDLFSGVAVRGADDFHQEESEAEPMLGEFGRQFRPDKALSGAAGLGKTIVDALAGLGERITTAIGALEFSSPLRIASAAVILVIMVIFLVSTLSRCAGPSGSDRPKPALAVEENLNIAVDPPDTYLD